MANNEAPTFQQWIRERQAVANENRARAQAFYDTAKLEEKSLWTWIRDTFLEITNAFHALEWIDNYRSEADYKLNQTLSGQKNAVSLILKSLLGLDNTASDKDVADRAKEFGKLVDGLIGEKETLDKATIPKK